MYKITKLNLGQKRLILVQLRSNEYVNYSKLYKDIYDVDFYKFITSNDYIKNVLENFHNISITNNFSFENHDSFRVINGNIYGSPYLMYTLLTYFKSDFNFQLANLFFDYW